MKKLSLLLLSLTISATVFSQQYSLPSNLFDSLVYFTIQGKTCKNLAAAQEVEINKLTDELVLGAKAIRIQKDKNDNYELIISKFPQEIKQVEAIYQEREQKLKSKIRKMWVWITVEGGALVLLVILL